MKKGQPIFFSKPQDESLEAYKAWIEGMYKALTGITIAESDEPISEEEWIARWREFWHKSDGTKAEPLKGD